MTSQQSTSVLQRAALLYAVAICAGIVSLATLVILHANRADSSSSRIFFRMMFVGEPIGLAVMILFAIIGFTLYRRAQTDIDAPIATPQWIRFLEYPATMPLLVGVFAAGAVMLFDNESFSMDEYGAVLQAKLFAMGEVAARIPTEWRRHLPGITPEFVDRRPIDSAWVSPYLPGNAIIRAPFEAIGSGWLSGVLLAMSSVFFIARIARQLWPLEPARQLAVVAALALSAQFLLVAGTPYAMNAHLSLNLLWLWLWIGPDRRAAWAGPIGFFAFVLHQHVPHALFVAPFLLRALLDLRVRRLVWMGAWYFLALFASSAWRAAVGHTAGTGNLQSAFATPGFLSYLVLIMNIFLAMSWQTPLASLGCLVTVSNWRRLGNLEKDLVFGVALSLLAFLFFALITQGHGWGWRYGHQVLGNLALLTGFAWPTLSQEFKPRALARLAMVSVLLTTLVQYPARAYTAHKFAAPFARAHAWLRLQDADIVVVPTDSVWYGRDLLRNPIGLPRPILVREDYFRRINPSTLPQGVIKRVTVDELLMLGLERMVPSADSAKVVR